MLKYFLSCLKMHHFMASLPKWVLTSPKKTSSHIFKIVIFPKFFWAFMKHIIRWNAGEKIMLFPELFTNTIFEFSFVCFLCIRLYLVQDLKILQLLWLFSKCGVLILLFFLCASWELIISELFAFLKKIQQQKGYDEMAKKNLCMYF